MMEVPMRPKQSAENILDVTRTHILQKNNTGVSDTRNMGLTQATGKYVAFADCDDRYEKNALDSLCRILESTPEHDIYLFKANKVFATYKEPIDFPIQQGSWDGDSFRNTYYLSFALGRKTNGKNLSLPIWSSVFSKSFLQKFGSSFDTYLRKAEDFIFTVQVLSKASKIFVIHETYYNYRINRQSVSHKYIKCSSLSIKKSIYIINKLEEILKNHFDLSKYRDDIAGRYASIIVNFCKNWLHSFSKETVKSTSCMLSSIIDSKFYAKIQNSSVLRVSNKRYTISLLLCKACTPLMLCIAVKIMLKLRLI